MPKPVRPELVPFIELNAIEKKSGKKLVKERWSLIREYFPSYVKLDWHRAFARDSDLWGRLFKDVYERDLRELGEEKNTERARDRLRQLTGDDYSYDPFIRSLETLAGTRSVRHLATKLGLSPHMVWRLKNGTKEPDLFLIEQVAKAFGKDPSYFVEYRIAYVLGAIGDQMEIAPEMSVDMYRKIARKRA